MTFSPGLRLISTVANLLCKLRDDALRACNLSSRVRPVPPSLLSSVALAPNWTSLPVVGNQASPWDLCWFSTCENRDSTPSMSMLSFLPCKSLLSEPLSGCCFTEKGKELGSLEAWSLGVKSWNFCLSKSALMTLFCLPTSSLSNRKQVAVKCVFDINQFDNKHS